MVFIGDDIEAYLIVEGREVWRVEGRRHSAVQCPACGVMEESEAPPLPELVECVDCGATVRLWFLDAWRCSACGDAETDRDAFLLHIRDMHPPEL